MTRIPHSDMAEEMSKTRKRRAPTCTIPDCNKPHFARGWCCMHWTRWRNNGDPMKRRVMRGEATKFFEGTVLGFQGNECLIWPFGRNNKGYGMLGSHLPGKTRVVSRLVCEKLYGSPPSDHYQAAHSCGNGHLGCVNPNHLRWATPSENGTDRIAHGTVSVGADHPWSKISPSDAEQIRALAGKKRQKDIGALFGISQTHVSRILRGEFTPKE